MTVRVAAVATVLPEHRIRQSEIRRACQILFQGHPHLQKLLDVFAHSGIEERFFAFPLAYYLNGHTFAERNFDYIRETEKLGSLAVRKALAESGTRARDIDQFYFVTTTGLATPSIDALIVSECGFRPDILRNPLFGMGCAGGAAALGRAAHSLKGKTLILSVELCGQTFRNIDRSAANLVGAALFGDGAACVILDHESGGPEVVAWGSELFKGTRRVMGWDFLDDGFKLVLSRSVPAAVKRYVAPALKRFLKKEGLTPSRIDHFLLHPGGAKILAAYRETLDADLRWMEPSLRRIGNLSSAHVLFLLSDLLRSGKARAGDLGLLAAVGPGFAAEAVLLRW